MSESQPSIPLPFKEGSLLFAPMEGVTDEGYRNMLFELFDEWDYYFTDFLRVPGQGQYSEKKILNHYGESIFLNPQTKSKTGLQILTSHRAQNQSTIDSLNKLEFAHIDLNLGCPSKKVNAHLGGAYLLSDLEKLEVILKEMKSLFKGLLTVKIRIGYKDTDNFDELIQLINNCGAQAITIHGRTRDQLYKGQANWSYIQRAVKNSKVPIIGNGDVWGCEDIDQLFETTGCHSVMCARGALKTPWLAKVYRHEKQFSDNEAYLNEMRKTFIQDYYDTLEKEYKKMNSQLGDSFLLSRFKGLSRYLFDDFVQGPQLRSKLLRSQSLDQFYEHLSYLKNIH